MRIREVEPEEVDSLIYLCIPPERRHTQPFVEGANAKRVWAKKSFEKFGGIAKMAYVNASPVGLIQYQPKPEEHLFEITCIFVPNKQNHRKGIGKALLNALVKDAEKPKPFFDNKPPLALVTWAFNVPGYYPQSEFYLRMGFKKVVESDPNKALLYYPLKEGYVYKPKAGKFVPQAEDRGKALIFYDPSCPFCIYFAEQIKAAISEVAPNIPTRMINMFEEREEVEKRGKVPYCAVNGKPITVFFMDKENFQQEVREALKEN